MLSFTFLKQAVLLTLVLFKAGSALSEEKELVAAFLREFSEPHPLNTHLPATAYLAGFVNRHLVSLNLQGGLQADLLEGLPYAAIKDAIPLEARGAVWSLRLRDEARWGDGTPI